MVVQRGRRLEMDPAVNRLDGSLRGWAWVEGTFSWVEPTAYALISSRILGDLKSKRVLEGRAMLLDRQCADGSRYIKPGLLASWNATLVSEIAGI